MLLARLWLKGIKRGPFTGPSDFPSASLSLTSLEISLDHNTSCPCPEHHHLQWSHQPLELSYHLSFSPTYYLIPSQYHQKSNRYSRWLPPIRSTITLRALTRSTCHRSQAFITHPSNMAMDACQHHHPKPRLAAQHQVCRRTNRQQLPATTRAVQATTSRIAAPRAWISSITWAAV
jgi:hypothetical protein